MNLIQRTNDQGLFGKWTSDKSDEMTLKTLGDVTMTFTSNGNLIYEIKEKEFR